MRLREDNVEEKLTEVRLTPGKYSLYREEDRAGDSGMSWLVYDQEKSVAEGTYSWIPDSAGLIKVGYGIRVGSHYARSYTAQDWWQCSAVTEILEINEEKTMVRFRTRSSVYVAKSF